MGVMQTLRHMTLLVRLVLAGFLLSLGVASASPVVQPRSLRAARSKSWAAFPF